MKSEIIIANVNSQDLADDLQQFLKATFRDQGFNVVKESDTKHIIYISYYLTGGHVSRNCTEQRYQDLSKEYINYAKGYLDAAFKYEKMT